MRRRGDGHIGSETRLARWAVLQGDTDLAKKHFHTALALALNMPVPPRETVAWCYWQLGETAFSMGEYETAERRYRDALTTFPGYLNAIPSLGRVRAARGDLAGAIEQYEQAVRTVPDPTAVAALGDLYSLAGRRKDAETKYALVEQIGGLSGPTRQLAIFYADHDRRVERAYADAAREYTERRDIYGADALAWAALKAGKLTEAQEAIQAALRLGTRDAKLFYHAGMIARAAGDRAGARENLRRALGLNPQFDPLQSRAARQALEF